MKRIHDLVGDWFTMPSQADCEWCVGDGLLMGEPDHYERGTDAWLDCYCQPPAVGDVIANTRTIPGVRLHKQPEFPVWADPPFLRVTEVLPIKHRPSGPEKGDGPMVYAFGACDWWWRGVGDYEAVRLPGAVPGGWAIQVGPLTLSDEVTSDLHADRSLPPPTSTPLNGPFG